MDSFDLKTFLDDPSCEYLMSHKVRKDDWLALGKHMEIQVKGYWPKQKMVDSVVPVLISVGMISENAYDLVSSDVGAVSKAEVDIEFERIKLQIKEKELTLEAMKAKTLELESRERDKDHELETLKRESSRI